MLPPGSTSWDARSPHASTVSVHTLLCSTPCACSGWSAAVRVWLLISRPKTNNRRLLLSITASSLLRNAVGVWSCMCPKCADSSSTDGSASPSNTRGTQLL